MQWRVIKGKERKNVAQNTYVLEQCLGMDVAQLLVPGWLMKSNLAELGAILRLQNLPFFRGHSAKKPKQTHVNSIGNYET